MTRDGSPLSRTPPTAGRTTPRRRRWLSPVEIPRAESTRIVIRVRRLRGQIQAIERALDHEGGRSDVLRLIVRARGTINRLMAEVLESYIRTQVAALVRMPDAKFARTDERLIDGIHSCLK
jgi:FrmR/RcnR family transcriptional regulator, repressor of frmRAB operon